MSEDKLITGKPELVPPPAKLEVIKNRFSFLARRRAVPGEVLLLWPLFRSVSNAIGHWQNGNWVLQKVRWLMGEHNDLWIYACGVIWLTAVALWPRKHRNRDDIEVKVLGSKPEKSLADRVSDLVRDLRAFLQRHPEPVVDANLETQERFRQTMLANWHRLPNIHDGYMAEFKDRVEKIIFELGAKGIRDFKLNSLANSEMHSDSDIQLIADKLHELGAQLVAAEAKEKFEHKLPSQASETALPDVRPDIEPVGYNKMPTLPVLGFEMANDGEPAYDFSIPSVKLGTYIVNFEGHCKRLTRTDPHVFWRVLIVNKSGGVNTGNALMEVMLKQGTGEMDVAIHYRDRDRWYATICKFEVNVRATESGGITIRKVEQKIIPAPVEEKGDSAKN